MVNYTFTTDQGWKVTEYRPFSASYAVLHTPCMPERSESSQTGYAGLERYGSDCAPHTNPVHPVENASADNLLLRLTGQQLRFSCFSADVLRQLLAERVALRDRHRSSILGRLSDVSGEIYGASPLYSTPDTDKRRQGLEKTRIDLERQLREEDTTLWRDTVELRRELILAAKQYDSTQLRTSMFDALPHADSDDERKRQGDSGISG